MADNRTMSELHLKAGDLEYEGAHLIIPINEMQKIRHWASLTTHEVGGLGTIQEIKEKGKILDLVVDQVYLIEQEVDSTHTTLDDEGVVKLLNSLEDKNQERLVFWWHSHSSMDVFWSTQDEKCIEDYRPEKYMLSLVFNKKNEMKARLDIFRPYPVFMDDIPVLLDISDSDKGLVKEWLYDTVLKNGVVNSASVLKSFEFSKEVKAELKAEYDKKVRVGHSMSKAVTVYPAQRYGYSGVPDANAEDQDWEQYWGNGRRDIIPSSSSSPTSFSTYTQGREIKKPLSFMPDPKSGMSKKQRKKLRAYEYELAKKLPYEILSLIKTIFPVEEMQKLLPHRPSYLSYEGKEMYKTWLDQMLKKGEINLDIKNAELQWAEKIGSSFTTSDMQGREVMWMSELWDNLDKMKGILSINYANWPIFCSMMQELHERATKPLDEFADLLLSSMLLTEIYSGKTPVHEDGMEMEV